MQNNLLKNIVRDFAKSSATTSTIALIGSILGLGLVGVSPAGAVTFGTNLIIATATSVPEPSSIPGILVGGALCICAIKKRRQKP